MKRCCFLFFLIVWMSFPAKGAVTYSTERLRAIASRLSLPGIDTLSAGEYACYAYKSHPLTVRINEWKEVEHIGLALFKGDVRKKQPLVYDFLERYFLELDLVKGTEYAFRLGLENVQFGVGDLAVAFKLDGTEEFRQSYVTFRRYHVEWLKEGEVVLSLHFDMDCQLLMGCDVVELEKNYLKRLRRYKAAKQTSSVYDFVVPGNAGYYIEEGSSFIIDAIRNDLFFHKQDGREWRLVSDSSKPRLSIANVMLSMETEGDYDLSVIFDMYGYKEEKLTVKLVDWQGLCIEEGCVPYWGMKSKEGSLYKGTLFMVNEKSGFVHMLSVEFPQEILNGRKGTVRGRLYAYIPLHHITEKFFRSADYKKVRDEKKNL